MARKSMLKKETGHHVGMENSVLSLLQLLDDHYPYFVEAKDIELGRNTTHIVVQAYMDELVERLEPDASKEIRDPKTDYEKLRKNVAFRITIKGYQLLSQIRTKDAIIKFNHSSDKLSIVVLVFTAVMVVLAGIQIIVTFLK